MARSTHLKCRPRSRTRPAAVPAAGPDRGAEQSDPYRQRAEQQPGRSTVPDAELQDRRDHQAGQQHHTQPGEDVDECPGHHRPAARRSAPVALAGDPCERLGQRAVLCARLRGSVIGRTAEDVRGFTWLDCQRRSGWIGGGHRSMVPAGSRVNSARHRAMPPESTNCSIATGRNPAAAKPSISARVSGQGGPSGAGEPSGRITWMASNRPPGATRSGDGRHRLLPQRQRQRLHRVDLDDQIECLRPVGRQVEDIGHRVRHGRASVPGLGKCDGAFRDVEGAGAEPEAGQVLGIGAEPAADDDRGSARADVR